MPNTPSPQDLELAKFFTDVEPLRDWFEKAIVADKLPKRLLVIWGVGGIGKSSVLRMFRLNCKTARVPVGLASGDEAKSAVDVLTRWAEDLKNDGANFPTFFKTLEHYRAIQAKVEDQTKTRNKKLGDVAGKAAGKVAEAGAAVAVGAVVGSVIPGIGTLAGAVGGMGAEALVDYLRGFLSKPDIDLLLDPSKKLTDDFLADVNQIASKQRVVLMLDTYEQMTALDDWTCEFAQQLNENVLLVTAGRAMVNWGRKWDSWLMHAEVQELKTMPKRVMHELIRKYYSTMRGGEPNPKQVNAIIEFSGGLPMVVNTAVQLWVKYGVEDFGAVKGEVVREVVERLREGVPSELYPLLETAAALRYFNKDILRAVSGMGDINANFDELRRFPFVRSRAEGYALHDRVRDMIEENVRTDDPAKYRGVHERAAAYFEARMANATSAEMERLGLERLYHRVCVDEESGMRLFQEMAEDQVRYRFIYRLRSFINDVNSYKLELDNSVLWREYYNARLAHFDLHLIDAGKSYEMIAAKDQVEPRLKAYALRDWGNILMRTFAVTEEDGWEKALQVVKKAISFKQYFGTDLIHAMLNLSGAYSVVGDYASALDSANEALAFSRQQNNIYAEILSLENLRTLHGLSGNWVEMFKYQQMAEHLVSELGASPYIISKIMGGFPSGWSCAGRYAEAEQMAMRAIQARQEIGDRDISRITREAALAKGMQGKYEEAETFFSNSLEYATQTDDPRDQITLVGRARILSKREALREAQHLLQQGLESKQIVHWQRKIEVLDWIGELNELLPDLLTAEDSFIEARKLTTGGRHYFQCFALTGLVRVKHAQHDYAAIPPLLAEAEQLAQHYEYNDHLASLRLTQGHVAWDGHIPEWGKGFDAAFEFYKLALVYALRFNRFLLDEVFSGRPQGTPLRPIIPECLKRGEEGRKMLLALREWWQTGKNDVGTPRPDTISPIPENIALLEAEKIAREREPGDSSAQTSVVKQIENALNQS